MTISTQQKKYIVIDALRNEPPSSTAYQMGIEEYAVWDVRSKFVALIQNLKRLGDADRAYEIERRFGK